MSLKVQTLESGSDGLTAGAAHVGREQPIPFESLNFVDWEKAYIDIIDYKERKGMVNLAIRPDTPKRILSTTEPTRLYRLVADESVVKPRSFADIVLLQETAITILRKYADKFYSVHQERWDSEHMVYRALDDEDANFQDYTIKIARSEKELIAAVKKLIDEGTRIYKEETHDLPNIHFDRHLYQPLLVERGDKVRSEPPGLNESERKFVEDIRAYCREEKGKSLANKEIYLLRNLSRSKGIGFFASRGFYPDFIMWIKDGGAQRIIFIEPHGMLHEDAYEHNEKARLHESLPNLAKAMGTRANLKNVALDSFIISATPYEDLRKKYEGSWDKKRFAEAHILFPERDSEYDYLTIIISQ